MFVAAVEDVLETALYNAGMIRESNYGELSKIKWARSSRTDKGVHSLTTVISCKLELQRGVLDSDPEGEEHRTRTGSQDLRKCKL